ncbi:DNA primase large subunit [Corchorus olitorius]|uniref:DNA primase large subunit n=1 Tax=Corchorus olitorius TaxID=93759 RepID=A0A1R3HBA1_9ROSI|nr:DNA primase large subunit [Corchorus olitorius]
MHCQIAESEASNQQQPRGCRVKRRKFKKRNEARYQQKRKWRTIFLQKEFEELAAENTYLKEAIECLLANYLQVPARDPQKEENNVSLSATQLYDPNLDGLELGDLLLDEEIPICEAIQENTTMGEFLMKIDDDVASNVEFPDFTFSLEGKQKRVGRYNFPLALVPTVERIINVYGDISTGCLINSNAAGQIYVFLCATIKEMEEVELDQVTEENMLKWRDAIKDALRINFKVEFAIDHLKKIARAYFGRKGSQTLHDIDEKLDALYKERAETYEVFKDCLADAKAFHGKCVGTGLFP